MLTTAVVASPIVREVELHERIAWCGENRAPSLRALSIKCGFGPTGLQSIVDRKSKRIGPEKLQTIATKASVSVWWLTTGQGTPDSADDARSPSSAESDTPHLVNAVGYEEALAEAKRREPKIRAHAWEALDGSKRYAIRGIVQPEELIKLARVYEELADPARMAAALAAQDERIRQLMAERAAKPEPAAGAPKAGAKPAAKKGGRG